jgi:hypothetical protein
MSMLYTYMHSIDQNTTFMRERIFATHIDDYIIVRTRYTHFGGRITPRSSGFALIHCRSSLSLSLSLSFVSNNLYLIYTTNRN